MPGLVVVGGGAVEVAAFLGEDGEFFVGGEVVGVGLDGPLPASDALGERGVDVVEGLLGGGAGGGVAVLTDTVEGAAGFGFAPGFVAEVGVLEGGGEVAGIGAKDFSELIARGLGVAGFEEGVGEVLADRGLVGRVAEGLLEGGDGAIVVAHFERVVGGSQGTAEEQEPERQHGSLWKKCGRHGKVLRVSRLCGRPSRRGRWRRRGRRACRRRR